MLPDVSETIDTGPLVSVRLPVVVAEESPLVSDGSVTVGSDREGRVIPIPVPVSVLVSVGNKMVGIISSDVGSDREGRVSPIPVSVSVLVPVGNKMVGIIIPDVGVESPLLSAWLVKDV